MTTMASDKNPEQKTALVVSRKLRRAVKAQASVLVQRPLQVVLESHLAVACIVLRGQPSDKAVATLVHDISGLDLPLIPNTFCEKSDMALCWMRPDEWLLIGDAAQENVLAEQFCAAIDERKLSMVSTVVVGGTYVLLQLSGDKAAALLGKGCTLDLHPRNFAAGRCAQSLLAKAPVLLWRGTAPFGNKPVWNVLVRRSFSEYLGLWLLNAGEEFGLQARL